MAELYELFREKAEQFPRKTALISEGERYSYSELLQQANKWAACLWGLLEENQRPRVALLTEDPLYNTTISLAIAQLDGACIPTNPQMQPAQLLTSWLATDVTHVIYDPAYEGKIKACPASDIQFLSTSHNLENPSNLIAAPFAWSDKKDFLITLSSGSTGAPKPIVISQDVKNLRARQIWDLYDLTPDDVVLCASPFFHSLGQRLVFVPLLLGATLVHMEQFTPKKWLSLVDEHQVTFVISVSSHLYALKNYLLNNTSQLKSFRTIVTSSAPIDAHFKEQIFQATGCNFYEIYGATEVAVASNLVPDDAQEKYTTVGLPCNGIEIKILDEDGKEVPYDTIGEIATKSPLVFEEYYNRPDLTDEALRDGFFLTGDLGIIDADGFLSYVGRKKDLIISGGINIYPKDIETVISAHEAVHEVAVIGIENTLLGEVVVAVCITEGQVNIERDLHKLANKHLAAFQRPLKYFFPRKLPLTPTGKVSKRKLREEYNKGSEEWTLALRMMLYGE